MVADFCIHFRTGGSINRISRLGKIAVRPVCHELLATLLLPLRERTIGASIFGKNQIQVCILKTIVLEGCFKVSMLCLNAS